MSNAVEIHRKAVTADLQTMATTLTRALGAPITAYIVHVRNTKTVARWVSGEVTTVRDRYTEERLLAAYQIVSFLEEYEADETIRAFMLGMNPTLDDEAPAKALREGAFADVMGAAKVLVAGAYS